MKRKIMCSMNDLNVNFTTLKNDIQRHEILCLKSVFQLDPSLNDFIGSGPEMYDNTGCSLYPQIWRQLRIPKWIGYIFTAATNTGESPVAIQDASITSVQGKVLSG